MHTFFDTATLATFVAVVMVLLLESLARAVASRSVAIATMALAFALQTGGNLPRTTNSPGELVTIVLLFVVSLTIAELASSFAFRTGDTEDTDQPAVGGISSSESCKIFCLSRTRHLSVSMALVEG
jgi:hypothetical protein